MVRYFFYKKIRFQISLFGIPLTRDQSFNISKTPNLFQARQLSSNSDQIGQKKLRVISNIQHS